jgi:hypothetical protein
MQYVQLHTVARHHDRHGEHARAARRIARVRARVRSSALDRALIEGTDPASSSALAARAAWLTARHTRAEIAARLERLARISDGDAGLWRVAPKHRAVTENEQELLALAATLRGPDPLYARGLAMLRRLTTDGAGPMYTDATGVELAATLSDARAAMTV